MSDFQISVRGDGEGHGELPAAGAVTFPRSLRSIVWDVDQVSLREKKVMRIKVLSGLIGRHDRNGRVIVHIRSTDASVSTLRDVLSAYREDLELREMPRTGRISRRPPKCLVEEMITGFEDGFKSYY